jgi:predicted ferric reductase
MGLERIASTSKTKTIAPVTARSNNNAPTVEKKSIDKDDNSKINKSNLQRGSTSSTTVLCEECSPFDDIDIAQQYEESMMHHKHKSNKKDGFIDTSNRPHTMLETPTLYRLCQLWYPAALEWSHGYYNLRWRISYPLQHKVTLNYAVMKMGLIASWGEILLIVPFFAALVVGIMFSLVFPDVTISGKVARAGLIASLVFAQRANSIVTFLLGMPVDRALHYHKLAGRLAGVASFLHLIAFFLDPTVWGLFPNTCNASGSIMMLIIVGIIITSVPNVRRHLYEAFYLLHLLGGVGLVIGAFFHSGSLVPTVAVLTWGADSMMRYFATTRHTQGTRLTQLSDTVVELQFPKTFDYNPGQYVYIKVPELSRWQWHPFSICSAPCCPSGVVTLRIRSNGDWTARLFTLLPTKTTNNKRPVVVLVQGPYGNLAIDVMADDRKYRDIVLIGGGIGVTPMQSVLDQILHEQRHQQRQLRSLTFVWVERDAQLLRRLYEDYLESLEKECVDLRLYCTGSSASLSSAHHVMMPPCIRWGRPEMEDIFARELTGKVAVLCSASPHFMDACREACIWFSDDTVRYDFHSEAMAI